MRQPDLHKMFLLAVLFFECGHHAKAQLAQLAGTVTDPNAAVVPSAAVSVTSVETGLVRKVETNDEGAYTIPLLQPGVYDVSVEASGFRPATRKSVKLDVQQSARLDFSLEAGDVAEVVQVTSVASLTDPATSTLGQVIENKRITDLPLNGRNPLELSRLAPGVNLQASTFLDVRNFNLTSVSINGGQGGSNAVLLDGASATLPERNEYAVAPNVDAVQEFRVQTNASSAEFGLTGGGVINLVTKSGSNDYHGTLFEFLRNDVFDANSYTNNRRALPKAPLRFNQFGGSVGGPVVLPRFGEGGPRLFQGHNRLFFFFNYEGYRYRTRVTRLTRVPTALERQGDFSQTFIINSVTRQPALVRLFDPATTRNNPAGPGQIREALNTNVLPASRLSPVALKALSFIPLPNRTADDVTGRNNYAATPSSFTDNDQYNLRVDYQIGSKNRLFGRYTQNNSVNTGNAPVFAADNIADPEASSQDRRNKNFVLSDTHAFNATVFNEMKFSVSRQRLVSAVPGLGHDAPAILGLPRTIPPDVFPRFEITDVTAIGNNSGQYSTRGLTVGELADTVRIVAGKHSLSFGADLRNNLRNNFQPSGGASGRFVFSRQMTGDPQDSAGNTGHGLATFLLGAVSGGALDVAIARADGFRTYSGFVNDDYKATSKLTLNLGLRYDLITSPTERFDRYSNFDPTALNPVTGRPGVLLFSSDFGRRVYKTDRNNFGPRIGFAYDVFGDAVTVIRAGYGIFYYHSGQFEYPDVLGSSASTPFQSPLGSNFPSFNLASGPAQVNQPVGSALGARSFLGNSVSLVEPNSRTPSTQQFNLGIQRVLPKNILIDVAYAGSKGTHIIGFLYNLNQLDPQYLSLGTALDTQVPNPFFGIIGSGPLSGRTISRRQSLLDYPAYLSVLVLNPRSGSTSYHSAQLKVEKRFSQGLSFLASYTFSKLIGDVGRNIIDFSTSGGGQQNNVPCGQNTKYDRRSCRSVEPQDVTHILVTSFVYELPFGPGRAFLSNGGALSQILGGFQLNGITTLRSGLPLVVRGANNGAADRPNISGSAKLSNGQRGPERWFDTSVFTAPASFTFGNVPRTLPDARGPGFASCDISLVRNFRISDQISAQLRAETFNLFNRTNYLQPDTNFLSSGFGTITSADEPRRIQFGMKLYF